MDARMERLDPAVEDLGEAGDVRNRGSEDPLFLKEAERAARRDDLDAEAGEAAGKVLQAGLVEHRDQGTARRLHGRGSSGSRGGGSAGADRPRQDVQTPAP